MITQGKIKTLKVIMTDLKALQDEVNTVGVKQTRLKEIKGEIIDYAELFDNIRLSEVTEEDRDVLLQKKKAELKLGSGNLKNRLQEVIGEFLGKVIATIEQEQSSNNTK